MESKNSDDRVPLISKIAYGFGDVGCNFSWMFVSNFLMIFYTMEEMQMFYIILLMLKVMHLIILLIRCALLFHPL